MLRVYTRIFFLQNYQHLQTYDKTVAVGLIIMCLKLGNRARNHSYCILVDLGVGVFRGPDTGIRDQVFLEVSQLEDSPHGNFLCFIG